jgi:hypothetical protein
MDSTVTKVVLKLPVMIHDRLFNPERGELGGVNGIGLMDHPFLPFQCQWLLFDHFVQKFGKRLKREKVSAHKAIQVQFTVYDWSGFKYGSVRIEWQRPARPNLPISFHSSNWHWMS